MADICISFYDISLFTDCVHWLCADFILKNGFDKVEANKITVFLILRRCQNTPNSTEKGHREVFSEMEGFLFQLSQNILYTFHPQRQIISQNSPKINNIMHFSTQNLEKNFHFLLMDLRLGLGTKVLILKDGLQSPKQKAGLM